MRINIDVIAKSDSTHLANMENHVLIGGSTSAERFFCEADNIDEFAKTDSFHLVDMKNQALVNSATSAERLFARPTIWHWIVNSSADSPYRRFGPYIAEYLNHDP